MSKWIKPSEMRPEKDGNYLITNIYGEVHEISWAEGWNCSRKTDGTVFNAYKCEEEFIVAWMPMPDAYEED